MSAERLRRFFVPVDGGYRIGRSIRDSCVFARHNVLTDPPFSRIDLVSCRNMLIYLGHDMQQRVVPTVHYALRPDGYLWLGSSETIGSYHEYFEPIDTQQKIYRKRGKLGSLPPLGVPGQRRPLPRPGSAVRPPELSTPLRDMQREADRLLLARYAPPSVLIRSDLEILQYRGDTSQYFSPASGRASLNVLKMLREGLVMGTRAAIEQAQSREMPVRREDLSIRIDGSDRQVAVEVIPIRSGIERAEFFMVVFDEMSVSPGRAVTAPALSPQTADGGIAGLKQELAATREYLQSVVEQHETANEELQSANEEVQSANEELQSVNEELETSKEEIQSSSEELETLNEELRSRNDELERVNNDLINLLSSVHIAMITLDSSMRIRRFTPMAEKLLNLIPADIGRPLSDMKLRLDVPDLDTLVTDAMDSMAGHEREVRDGEGRWHLLRIRPYRTLERKIDGAVIVLFDVDTLKRSQEMLRRHIELLDQAHEPIIMWEVDGGISYWNAAAEETYGFTREQALGRNPHELLLTSPDYPAFREVLFSEGAWTGELVHTRRDGQKVIVESRMVTVRDTRGQQLVVEANRPITERKESERILRRAADDLVAADRHKDEFLAMLAHELRNPLAPLRNVVSVLRSPRANEEVKSRALDVMQRQIANMARLIDDLLDVSRITLSQIELKHEIVDLADILRHVVELLHGQLEARGQTLHLTLPTQPLRVSGDPVRLEQIVSNLVGNATKYTHEGGNVWLSLEEAQAPAGSVAVVTVRDDGMGIQADKLPHVFDLFMRATRSIDQQQGGLGIGLTLVRRLTELHGGSVQAESDGPGAGSLFTVRLPLVSQEPARVPAPDPTPARQGTRRVLVVDDIADNVESLVLTLEHAGHEARGVDNGLQALEVAQTFGPDAIVLDIGMPGMDGYELARCLRRQPGRAKTVLIGLSGYGDANARQRASDAGIDHYLVKPPDLTLLLSLI